MRGILQGFDGLQKSRVPWLRGGTNLIETRFKRIDRLNSIRSRAADSESRLIKIKIWVKYKENPGRWSLIPPRIKMIDEIQKNRSSIKARSSQIVLSSSDLWVDHWSMSIHLSTVSVRSHSIKCSEHASKLSEWKRYDFLKLVEDERSTIRSDSGSKGPVTWSARDRASCFHQWIDTL